MIENSHGLETVVLVFGEFFLRPSLTNRGTTAATSDLNGLVRSHSFYKGAFVAKKFLSVEQRHTHGRRTLLFCLCRDLMGHSSEKVQFLGLFCYLLQSTAAVLSKKQL